ncbi:C3H1-type domain-containing protein [Caenorhabditis elegans]|uniref:C3H1-type domain-containing protein n=1 Tax=Caenorhabditis elegans TaxID=6239 RepID=H2KZI4_CAEEL|nr:C3H1-type domain-containing protein [Caenorhabditis elegans]CCD68296.1 C3H1-type domain-containing protein [Caenorhabditis elegans]|eukprot:NP_741721.2 Zinc Finger Protein [Caenorhabditis elegans]
MADVYTPTKTMDGAFLPAVGSPNTSIDSPAVYVPTPLTAPSTSKTTPVKPEDQTTRQKYGGTWKLRHLGMRWRCALPTRRFPLSQPLFLCSVDTTIHILMNYRTLQNFSKILKGLGKMGKCNFKSGQKPRFIIKKRLWIPGNYGHSYGSLFSIVNPHHFSDSPISCSPCFFYVSDFFFFSIFLCVRSFFADALSFIWNILQWFRLQSRAKWRRRYI